MIAAHYFDGRSARLQPAWLDVSAGALLVSAGGIERSYPLENVRLAEPFAAAPAMLRFPDGASCEVPAGEPKSALLEAIGYRKGRVERWQQRWPLALLSLGLLTALLAFAYLRVLPFAAERIAATLPPSVDATLGKAALSSLTAQGVLQPSRLSDARVAEVQALLPRVLPPHPRVPARILVRHAPAIGPNAFALPDGTIVVTDSLVRLTWNSVHELTPTGRGQLIGVIGHEVGHLEHRHAARALVGSSLTTALSAALFGDFSAVAAGAPALLSQMQYSRDMELEADAYAVDVLHRNGLSAGSLIQILDKLERQNRGAASTPRWFRTTMSYMSTHPATAERDERLTAVMREEDQDAKVWHPYK